MHTLTEQVEAALDLIRPYLIEDGGNVELVAIDDQGEVQLKLTGACGTCEMSEMTLKAGIEDTIKRNVPGIGNIVAVKH